MDSSFVTRPPPAVANSRALRDPVAVRGTIDVELVDSKIVNSDERGSGGSRGGRQDATKDGSKDGDPRGDHPPHDLVANPEASQVILRERDVRVQEREHPDHALLRLRAYRPSVDDTTFAPSDDPHADFKA